MPLCFWLLRSLSSWFLQFLGSKFQWISSVCTPSFIDLSLLVFWCTYIAKHFKQSLPSWLSNLVESMFLCIHKKNYEWCSLSISFLMIIKKNWRPNCSNPFSLNIAELIEHLNGWKKTIYWLYFLNLPPLKELQQIFVLYEAKVMIYWPKSGKNTKSWPYLFNFECKQKNIGSNSRFAKFTLFLPLHILLVWADLHVSWFSDDYPLCSFSC